MTGVAAVPRQARPARALARRRDLAAVLGLALVVSATFARVYDRTSLAAWKTPITYHGDSIFLAAYLKAASEGHVFPGAGLHVPELNAPFEANWNDHPRTLRIVFLAGGLLARAVGLFAALNLLLLLAHVAAALTFYATARHLGARPEWAFVGGLAFGLSHFLFWRTLDHLDLAFCWHVPLCVLVVTWAFGRNGLELRSRRFAFAALVTVVAALHNPYYSCLYAQFLLLAMGAHARRRTGRASLLAPLALLGILLGSFVIDNAGSLAYQWRNGSNSGALRPYGNLERYALKPIELLLPPPGFGLASWGQVARIHWEQRLYRAEGGSSYLGLLGASAFVALLGLTVSGFLSRPAKAPPPAALAVAWIVLFSAVGGVNQVLGLMGFMWLRGTSRLSVWILTLVLLYLVTRRFLPSRFSLAAATVAAAIVLADQVPRRPRGEDLGYTKAAVADDAGFVTAVESSLPDRAMVFMLPVVDFPEGNRNLAMSEYDHLRPYLFAKRLRFSFGSDKGRAREAWQRDLELAPPAGMVADLERYGFGGILVNRRGYLANGDELLSGLAACGRPATFANPAGDYIFVPLNPSASVVLPRPTQAVSAR